MAQCKRLQGQTLHDCTPLRRAFAAALSRVICKRLQTNSTIVIAGAVTQHAQCAGSIDDKGRGQSMIDLSGLETWFVTGSQHLYGQDTLQQVERHATAMGAALSASRASYVGESRKRL